MSGIANRRIRYRFLQGAAASATIALSAIWMVAATPAMALNIDPGNSYDLGNVRAGQQSEASPLVGISARHTADSDPASLRSRAGEVSDKADTTQSIYCKQKGGVLWYAADLLSAIASKPDAAYQVEAMRCP